jgi:hypothetical protein
MANEEGQAICLPLFLFPSLFLYSLSFPPLWFLCSGRSRESPEKKKPWKGGGRGGGVKKCAKSGGIYTEMHCTNFVYELQCLPSVNYELPVPVL